MLKTEENLTHVTTQCSKSFNSIILVRGSGIVSSEFLIYFQEIVKIDFACLLVIHLSRQSILFWQLSADYRALELPEPWNTCVMSRWSSSGAIATFKMLKSCLISFLFK